MLVIISDLHLTDGTTGSTIGANAFRDFRDRLTELAYDASWRDNRKAQAEDASQPNKIYRPIEQFDLILLGDVLDIIRSSAWTENDCKTRPWEDTNNPNWDVEMATLVDEIVERILKHNHQSLSVLRELSAEREPLNCAPNAFELEGETVTIDYQHRNQIEIPAANQSGMPDPSLPPVTVPAHIYYFIGNHDWFFISLGKQYDAIRAKTVEMIGLANDPNRPFPWDVAVENHPELASVLQDHQVFVRHGDLYDEFNFNRKTNQRDSASLGDALVIELINRFPVEVEKSLRERQAFRSKFIDNLKEIANVRPMNSLPAWLNSLLESYRDSGMDKSMRREVQSVWNRLVDELLETDFIIDQDSFNPIESVDKLQVLLRTSKFVSIGRAQGLIEFGETASRVVQSAVDPYAHEAAQEPWLQDGRAKYVVYGHTHGQRVVPLDRKISAEKDEKLIYFNCGTWKRLHEQTIFSGEGTRFVDFLVMSYIAFFKDDERSGRPFETWTGTLGTQSDLEK